MNWRSLIVVLALACAFLTGCGREDVKVYTVPKERLSPAAQPQLPADHPELSAATATPQLTWKLPEGWEEVPAGNMRVASFKVAGKDGQQADVSVIPLPGAAGDDLSNVNRWRGQVGQPPIAEEELKTTVQTVELAGQPAALYDQAGESAHILAAIQRRAGTAWFFKVTGDNQLVAQQKPAFVEFLKSVQFAADAPELPVGHPDVATMPPPATPESATAGTPQWNAPPDWKEVPAGQFLVAKFAIAGGQAAVNISSSAGNGGGLAANVNRWRKQLGLGELTGNELAKSVTTIGVRIALVEMTGERAALVGAIVNEPQQTWFYKLMGDPKIVAAQKDAFVKFVQEAQH